MELSKRLLISLVTLSLIGCAGHKKRRRIVTLPSGQEGYAVACHADRMDVCYKRAKKLCPEGYTVLDPEAAKEWASTDLANRHRAVYFIQCNDWEP